MSELSVRIQQNPGTIQINYEELEKVLDEKLSYYKGAVFTEESKDIAKKEIADLRRLKKDIEDVRKGIKKQWMLPLEEAEAKLKALALKVDQPINEIDDQLKEFEIKRVQQKKARINELFISTSEKYTEVAEFVSLVRIFNPKWTNATFTMKKIEDEMTDIFNRVADEVTMIQSMRSDKTEDALEAYKSGTNCSDCIRMIQNYEQEKVKILELEKKRKAEEEARRAEEERRLAEARVKAEEERQRAEEAKREAEAERKEVEKQKQINEELLRFAEEARAQAEAEKHHQRLECPFDDAREEPEAVVKVTVNYKVHATVREIEDFEACLNSIGIEFEKEVSW